MKSLGTILSNKSFVSPVMKGVSAALAVEAANNVLTEIFGIVILQHASGAYLKNGILAFACLSSTAAQEIRLREKEIIERINNKLPIPLVKKLQYLS